LVHVNAVEALPKVFTRCTFVFELVIKSHLLLHNARIDALHIAKLDQKRWAALGTLVFTVLRRSRGVGLGGEMGRKSRTGI
jgi:hypothetical protein